MFFLRNRLGAEITVHGVLVEIFGVGVLILGPSGIGKSESALELVTRGHRLIADDMVIVHRGENRSLMGSGSALAHYRMEIRGIGIIDIKELYGVAAVLATAEIELVVQLEEWNNGAHYDRLGLEEHYRKHARHTRSRTCGCRSARGGTSPSSSRSPRATTCSRSRGTTPRAN